jgi:hypothetical protein
MIRREDERYISGCLPIFQKKCLNKNRGVYPILIFTHLLHIDCQNGYAIRK